jgi:dihydrofolate synthase/folylpolyglutamate synthase
MSRRCWWTARIIRPRRWPWPGALHEVAPKQPVALVSSFLSDKDAVGFLREMAGGVRRLWLVPLANERAMSMADMLTAARGARLDAASAPNLTAALVEAKAWAREQKGLVCVAGSLYLAGEALQRYGIKP